MDSLSEEVSLIISISVFLLLVAIGIVALVLVYQKKQTQYIQEQNRLKAAFEKELLEAQIEIQEQTLKNIAQEIHDNINQTLGLVKLNLNTLNLQQQQGTAEKISTTKDLVGKAITDLRTLSKTLHKDAVLSEGLAGAIETNLKLIDKASVFGTRFSVSGQPFPLDPQKEIILFRTVQEALNNSIKHSEASVLEIHLHYQPEGLHLTVRDNGRGFDLEAAGKNPDKGSGLRNMENRTRLIGGSLTIQPATPGTKILINLPNITDESKNSTGR